MQTDFYSAGSMDHTGDESTKVARRLTQQITDGLAEHQRVGSDVFGAVYQEDWDSKVNWEPQYEKERKSDATKSIRMDARNMAPNVLDGIILDETAGPISIPLAILQQITDNFNDSLKIGQGGFGVVYKGFIQSGCVAVKKLLNSHTIKDGPFYRETSILMSVNHPNIVRFLGYCSNTENTAVKLDGPGIREKYIYAENRERLLCFEYISKGGLDKHVTDELRGLEWHTRYRIIKGICEGLRYLHKEKNIIHMDLKPANILLDDLLIPKITDFGISKQLEEKSHAITMARFGSMGYCAPEYLYHGIVSFKGDIFSLGTIIMDLVSGRKEKPNIKNILRRWRYRWNKSGKYPPLGSEQVTKCIEIAALCMSYDVKKRPDILDVISSLNEMETTTEHIGQAGESSVGQTSPYDWELLGIDPLELHFPFEINKHISCSLELSNAREDCVAFHIEPPSTRHYRIEPNRGIVPPQSRTNVIVTLEAQEKAPHDMRCQDEFVVRCTIVNEGLTPENVSQDMFDEKSTGLVDEATLTVAF
ncbi:hypothetical protein CFC21_059693 [Triticum aestivum]|uniref:Protein kinase domain-containing protein n=2 Tax=Triticum aestivum TaxID=4565 RepID=A0A9R1GR88_WHEAT|nr:hypothetical protein CFC21_059693 [Triticum aestivum]